MARKGKLWKIVRHPAEASILNMELKCPLCGVAIPPEDQDIPSPPGEPIVAQVLCRPCGKAFSICEEKRLMRIRGFDEPYHPEDQE